MENALNRYLQKQDKGPATPLDRLASADDAAETAARLRLAAPEVAQEVEQRTLAQEMVLVKLAALEIADEEVDGFIAEVRESMRGQNPRSYRDQPDRRVRVRAPVRGGELRRSPQESNRLERGQTEPGQAEKQKRQHYLRSRIVAQCILNGRSKKRPVPPSGTGRTRLHQASPR